MYCFGWYLVACLDKSLSPFSSISTWVSMCPSAESPPRAELCFFLTDDQIIPFLNEYPPQSHLPNNVLADWSPYQYPPSNLPDCERCQVHSDPSG